MKRASFRLLMATGLLVTLFCNHVLAQESKTIQFGVKSGINFAELFGDDAIPESDRKVGYSFGTYMNFKLTKDLKLQPELIWSLQGEKSESKGRYNISYLNVPIMLKWTEKRFYTELGPQLGIMTINTSKDVPQENLLENFETFDLSINAGLGYEVYEDWTLGIRYCQGITNIVENLDLKNSVIYIGIAYRIF